MDGQINKTSSTNSMTCWIQLYPRGHRFLRVPVPRPLPQPLRDGGVYGVRVLVVALIFKLLKRWQSTRRVGGRDLESLNRQ